MKFISGILKFLLAKLVMLYQLICERIYAHFHLGRIDLKMRCYSALNERHSQLGLPPLMTSFPKEPHHIALRHPIINAIHLSTAREDVLKSLGKLCGDS